MAVGVFLVAVSCYQAISGIVNENNRSIAESFDQFNQAVLDLQRSDRQLADAITQRQPVSVDIEVLPAPESDSSGRAILQLTICIAAAFFWSLYVDVVSMKRVASAILPVGETLDEVL